MNDDRSSERGGSSAPSGPAPAPVVDPDVRQLRERLEASTRERSEERRRLTDHLLKVQAELNAMSRNRERILKRRRTAAQRHAREVEELTHKVVTLRYQRDLARWRLAVLQQRRWWRLGAALGRLRRNPTRVFAVLLEVVRIVGGASRPLPPRPEEPAPPRPPELPAASAPPRAVADPPQAPARLIAVATALDPETERSLSFEWVSQPITPDNWRHVLREAAPNLLLVSDTAWEIMAGGGSADDIWSEVVRAYREAGVPAVFWDTRRLGTSAVPAERAELFDHVVCSFQTTVDAYRSRTGTEDVHLFEPAVQTRLFHPAPGVRRADILGVRTLTAPGGEGPLAKAARSLTTTLDIETLVDGSGTASSAELATGYKTALAELSAATDEREIRRLLEIVATRTLVLAGGTIPAELSDLVFDASVPGEAMEALRTLLASDELRDRLSHRAWRRVREDHSLTRRVDDLLARIDVVPAPPLPRLTMMVPTNRPHKLTAILDNLARQTYPELSALLVLHGVDVDEGRLRDLAAERDLGAIDVLRVPEEVALGEVFNRGFAACGGDFVGKMDDDDYYGPDYASDLMADFENTAADIVGKWAHYAYSEALDATLLRYPDAENSFQDLLAISTLIMRPSVLEEVSFLPMEKGSGSQFLRAAGALGARVYAGNRFNYLYNRFSSDGHQHTWPVAEYEFASKSRFVCQGQNLAAVRA